jgi:Protein of unknown function (DUF4238)
MDEYTNHHFVPQFHLRQFAIDERQLSVGLFMICKSKFIPRASIKTQASRHKLYGATAREKMIGQIEGMCSITINTMLKQRVVPEPTSRDHGNLLVHVALQSGRTPEAGQQWEDSATQLMQTIMKQNPEPRFAPEDFDKVRIRMRNPVDEIMAIRLSTLLTLADLKYALLLNPTGIPFITSNHPVVYYNQFFERRRQVIGSGGAAVKGLQIFFPVSPTHYLIFYDGGVYDFGKGVMRGIAVKATDADVRALNGLQVISAQDHLYFDAAVSETQIRALVDEFRPKRQDSPLIQKTYPVPGHRSNPDGTFSTFMFSSTETLQIGLKLTCLSERPEVKRAVIRPNGHHFRTQDHYDLMRETQLRYLRERQGKPSPLYRQIPKLWLSGQQVPQNDSDLQRK